MDRKTQLKTVHDTLFDTPMTMMECARETIILRANICRYCRVFRLQGKLYIAAHRKCTITGALANVYTTNPKFRGPELQLSLFG